MVHQKNKNQKIDGGGFHHVAMRVSDFDASVKFYKEGLGFKETIAWGQGDHRAMMLDTGDGNYLEIFSGGSAAAVTDGAYIHVAFRTGNCDQAIEQARQAGAEVTVEPKDVEIDSRPLKVKVRIAFCKGPSGEVIEFFQNETL
jgi:glyoxylase I family protein